MLFSTADMGNGVCGDLKERNTTKKMYSAVFSSAIKVILDKGDKRVLEVYDDEELAQLIGRITR